MDDAMKRISDLIANHMDHLVDQNIELIKEKVKLEARVELLEKLLTDNGIQIPEKEEG